MKKRNRVRRNSNQTLRGNLLGMFGERNKRPRKAWMFERLEERHLFSTTPLGSPEPTYQSFSGVLTPEQVSMGELWWAFKQSSSLSQYSAEQLQNTTQWAIWHVDESYGNSASAFNPYLQGSYVTAMDTTGTPASEVIAMLSAAEDVVAFMPIIATNATAVPQSPMDEPLFEIQWHLRNTGQQVGNPDNQDLFGVPGEDIRVVGAWNQGVSGEGVVIGVVDSGFQTTHQDLFANTRNDLGVNFGDASAGAHGTAVAGLIAADGNNNYGGVGVAYNADIVNIDVGSDTNLSGVGTSPGVALAQVLSYRNDVIDIYNHSWGYQFEEFGNDFPTRQTIGWVFDPQTNRFPAADALRNSIRFGRPDAAGNPLGSIHVVAAGNSAGHNFPPGFANPISGQIWDSAVWNALVNRYTIGVGTIDHDGTIQNADGTFTNYGETGSNVLLVAPTGSTSIDVGLDSGNGSGIWTTDLTGANGYNRAGNDDGDFLDDPDFTSRFNGTSASTALVSGVVALMLEANPDLNYRDVQEILMRSARQANPDHESWQVNINDVFQAPATFGPMGATPGLPAEDPYNRTDDRDLDVGVPTYIAAPIDDYSVNHLPKFENGAGYTVSYSRGIFTEETGWAHGVVDADLAVKLAKQWHTNKQNNPAELTYTTFVRQLGNTAGISYIPAAAEVGPEAREDLYVIPGVMGGDFDEEFAEYYDEFWNDDPFSGDEPPVNDNGRSLPIHELVLEGFTPPLMEIEWIEVKVEIFDVDMNGLRVALRSPDGTISELNYFVQDHDSVNPNRIDEGLRQIGVTSPDDGSPFIWTFSTNRHWGERTDSFFEIDPLTGNPSIDPSWAAGNFDFDGSITGPTLFRTWDLIIENYTPGSSGFLDTFEVVFHGKPLAQNSERISGKVGIDSHDSSGTGDGDFNFERGIDVDVNGDGVIDTRISDPNQEEFASNVTVTVLDNNGGASDGEIVAQFVTGADGNFYFDLTPGDYTVVIDDPMGRTKLQDTGVDPQGFRYNTTWDIHIDAADNFTRTAGREVAIDANGDGIQDFVDLDGNGQFDPGEEIFRHLAYNDVNFLLDEGQQASDEVMIEGFVYADVNLNSVFDSPDYEAAGFRVYADLNNSGSFELDEPNFVTGADGTYEFIVTDIDTPQDVRIIAERNSAPIQGWVAGNPVTGRHTLFVSGGETYENVDFAFRPPADSDPDNPPDPGAPGTVRGTVYSDRNGNGAKNANDTGVEGVRVFVDADADGIYDVGEITDFTNQFGNFELVNVPEGSFQIDFVVPNDWIQTTADFATVQVPGGGSVSGVLFGIQNQATRDFGDLLGPGGTDTYGTTLANNGARHEIIPGFQLGARIDGETNGQPTANADGDDAINSDEDGVVLTNGALVPGVVNSVNVTVGGVGGYLNAWMDFDNSGTFEDSEHVIVDADLNPGTRTVLFEVPSVIAGGPIAARFRWGTAGLNYFGQAIIGEVEDYLLANSVAAPGGGGLVMMAADESESTVVDNSSSSPGMFLFASEVSASASTAAPTQAATTQTGSSDAQLLLLDQVLAGLAGDDDEAEADSIAIGEIDDESEEGGLALAAAFDEVSDWRYGF